MASILFWALIVTVGFAPLPLASNRPWAWGLLGLAVAVQLVLFAVAALFDRNLIQVAWRRYAWAMVGFAILVGWFIVQAESWTPAAWHDPLWAAAGSLLGTHLNGAIAIDPGDARTTIARLITYAGVFFLALQLCRTRAHANAALWSIVLAGAAYSIYGLFTYLGRIEMILWYNKIAYRESLTSTFVNRNSFGSYAGLTLIAAVGLLIAQAEECLRYGLFSRAGLVHFMDTVSPRFFLLIAIVFTIATALLLTGSRGAFFGTAFGIALLIMALRLGRKQHENQPRLPVSLFAVALAALVLIGYSGGKVAGRIGESGSGARGDIYASTIDAIAAYPLTGTGLGGFEDTFSRYRNSRLDEAAVIVDKAHNTYLELALEIGLPAMALWLAILGAIVVVCARGIVTRRRDYIFPAVAIGVTTLMALHSTVDFSLQMPAIAVAYALVMGVGFTQSHSSQRHTSSPISRRAPSL